MDTLNLPNHFAQQVRDALSHLYDYTHLQRHPLALLFFPYTPSEGPNRAQRLHRLLLETIEELSPPQHVPFNSPEWRGYRILSSRYVEGQSPQEIMEELAISRRQYFREQRKALQALVSLLREKLPGAEERTTEAQDSLLQAEAERIMDQQQSIALDEIVEGVLQAIHPLAEERGVAVSCHMAPNLPSIYANRTLLRQVFIQALSRLITSPEVHRAHLNVRRGGRWIIVQVEGTSASGERIGRPWTMESVRQLVEMLGGEWIDRSKDGRLCFTLPTNEPRILLAIDDNEGLIRLLRRYLAEHNYQVVEASNGADTLQLARELQPDVITLDVMMPSRDGWEILQRLKSEPTTQNIPVIVCSVLDDPELAFSLGATAYLKKPISQADLIEALSSLRGG